MRRISERVLVAVACGWFLAATLFTSRFRSTTYDETLHVVGGWTYWKLNDYRMHPTNGNLTQRWFTLPFFWLDPTLPDRESDFHQATRLGEFYGMRFLHEVNQPDQLLLAARGMNAIAGIAMVFMVWLWSRKRTGWVGGIIVLYLLVLCPNILAHSGLATSDILAAALFFAATWAWSGVLHFWSTSRLIVSSLATSVLFAVKMSAPLFIAMALVTSIFFLTVEKNWRWRLGSRHGIWSSALSKWIALLGSALFQMVCVVTLLWAMYGFRYSAFAEFRQGRDQFTEPWSVVLPDGKPTLTGSAISFARKHHLLPEAYLYGLAHTLRHAERRPAYLNGQYSETGWRLYFPIVFLMKTPIPTLIIIAMGTLVGSRRWIASTPARRHILFRRAAPFLVLIVVYGYAAIFSNLNIGYRHLLPVTLPMLALTGVIATAHPSLRIWTGLLLLLQCANIAMIYPYFLAYFNQIAGGPAAGFRRLADSNLDWGQDLPGLRSFVQDERQERPNHPIYLHYFGTAVTARYECNLPEPFTTVLDGRGIPDNSDLGGTYCISATILVAPSRGKPPWGDREEELYPSIQQAYAQATEGAVKNELRRQLLNAFQMRFYAGLLNREPDQSVGHSILIYRLTNDEVRTYLFGRRPR